MENYTVQSSSIKIQNPPEEFDWRVLNLSPDPIFAVIEGCFTFVNPTAVDLLGAASSDELLGSSFLERLRQGDQKRFTAWTNQEHSNKGVGPLTDVLFLRTDNSQVKLELRSAPFEQENRPGFLVFARNVNHEHWANQGKETVQESEMRYRLLYENSLDGWMLTLPDGRILSANPQACRLLGMTEEEICEVGRAGIVVPDPNLAAALRERKQAGQAKAELTFRRKDGTTFLADVSSGIFTDSDGIQKTSLTIHDITQRNLAEEKIRDLARFADENPHPMARVSKDGVLLFANRSATPLLTSLGHQVGNTLPKEWREWLGSVLESQQSKEIEFQWEGRTFTFLLVPIPSAEYVNVYGKDITLRKEAERNLQESEARFRTVFENAPIGIALVDYQTGTTVKANKILLELLGYDEQELINKNFTEFTHPDDLAVELPFYHELVDGKRESYQIEKRYIRKDHQIIWAHLHICMIDNQKYVLGLVEGISERKKTEAELRYQAELLGTVKDAVIATDGQFKITHWNPAATLIYGWQDSEVFGRPINDLFETEFIETDRETVNQSIWKTGDFHGQVRHRRKDGSWVPIEANIKLIRDKVGVVTGMVGVNRDITERMRAENELRTQKEILQKVFDHIPVMINLISKDGTILFVNHEWEQALGWTLEEIQNQNLDILSEVYPDPEYRLEVLNFIFTTHMQWRDFKTKVRGGRVIDTSWIVIQLSEGIDIGLGLDISERKRHEVDLRHQIEENARRLEELETITQISSAMRQAHERKEMATLLIERGMCTMRAQAGLLAIKKNGFLNIEYASGDLSSWRGKSINQNEGIFQDILACGKPLVIESYQPGSNMKLGQCETEIFSQLAAGIAIPLKNDACTIGMMFFGYKSPTRFSEMQQKLISAIADMAGNALNRMGVTETLEELIASRTQELKTIYQVTSAASESRNLNEALYHSLELTSRAVQADIGSIYLCKEGAQQVELIAHIGMCADVVKCIESQSLDKSLEGQIIQDNKLLLLSDLAADPRAGWARQIGKLISFLGLPMRVGNRVVGVLCVSRPGGEAFNLEEMTLLSFIADNLGLIVENARLYQESEQNAIHAERTRLSRELHDLVTQQLYGATLYAAGMKEFFHQEKYMEAGSYMDQLGQITQQALKEMRLLVYELRSPILESSGLIGAIQSRLDAVERRLGVAVTLEAEELPDLPQNLEENVYRIILEALNNALKHASASHIAVAFHFRAGHFEATIEDNGIGFDLEKAAESGGYGLAGMRERVEGRGGTLQIVSCTGNGTRIRVSVPMPDQISKRWMEEDSDQ